MVGDSYRDYGVRVVVKPVCKNIGLIVCGREGAKEVGAQDMVGTQALFAQRVLAVVIGALDRIATCLHIWKILIFRHIMKTLLDMPSEIIQRIGFYLPNNDLVNLADTCLVTRRDLDVPRIILEDPARTADIVARLESVWHRMAYNMKLKHADAMVCTLIYEPFEPLALWSVQCARSYIEMGNVCAYVYDDGHSSLSFSAKYVVNMDALQHFFDCNWSVDIVHKGVYYSFTTVADYERVMLL